MWRPSMKGLHMDHLYYRVNTRVPAQISLFYSCILPFQTLYLNSVATTQKLLAY